MQQQFLRGNALDVLETLPSESVDTVVTSPPYWSLRKYPSDTIFVWDGDKDCEHVWGGEQNFRNQPGTMRGGTAKVGVTKKGIQKPTGNFWLCAKCGAWKGQLGLEPSFQTYVSHLLQIFVQVKRVLKSSGSFYLNIADTYAGGHGNSGNYRRGPNSCFPGETSKLFPDVSVNADVSGISVKSLIGVPWRLAIKMIDDQQWCLRNCVIWYKANHMPGSQKDRLTNGYEFIFHFVKNKKYYYDLDRIRIPHSMVNTRLLRKNRGESPNINELKEKIGDVHEGEATANLYRNHKEFHELGKNPSDVIRLQMEAAMKKESEKSGFIKNSNRLMTGLHVKGKHGIDVRHNHGKTPSDFLQLSTEPYAKAHFAKFPTSLPIFCIVPSTPPNGVVLDPFAGVSSTSLACEYLNRGMYNKIRYPLNDFAKKVKWQLSWIMVEPSEEYVKLSKERLGVFLVNKFKEQTSFDG